MMKLTTFLLFVGFLHVSASGLAQKISLNEKQAPLEKIFKEIRKQIYKETGYGFLYNTQQLQSAPRVDVVISNASLEDALKAVLQNTRFTYTIQDKTIVISPKIQQAPITQGLNPGLIVIDTLTVKGRVTDEAGKPAAGVAVRVKGSSKGTTTNDNGKFTLTAVDANAILVFSGVNMETYETVLNARTEINVSAIARVSQLQEVVVNKGYYSTIQRLNTGNVSTVKSEEINKQPVLNVLQALESKVPGLYITQGSGVPGSAFSVQIRGQNSIASGNNPLYIIDGIPFTSTAISSLTLSQNITAGGNPLSNINPSDIESIEILKDADATAIYGSRGANGVILITTKKGKSGKTELDVNFYSGIGRVPHFLPLMNTQQYLEMRREAFKNDGVTPSAADYDINGTWDTTRNTDWQRTLLGGTATTNNLNVSISGGNTNTQFKIAGNYQKQTTVFPGNFSDNKGIVHFSLNHLSSNQKLRLIFSTSYSSDINSLFGTDLTGASITLAPDAPPLYDNNGNINQAGGTWSNPLGFTKQKYKGVTNNLIESLLLSYQLSKQLSLKINTGYTKMSMNEIQTNPLISFNPANGYTPATIYSYYSNGATETWIVEPQLHFSRSVGRGKMDIILGSALQEKTDRSQTFQGTGFNNESLMESISAATTTKTLNDNFTQYRYEALFTRVSYNLDDKYILNLTGRRDGSSRFGQDRQFANFGAVGLAWIFSKERIVQDDIGWLSFGKARISYGTSGNDQIGDYQYLNSWSVVTFPYQGAIGLQPTRLANPDFRWEQNKKFEAGLELAFLSNRILFNTSYYLNRSDNQLIGYALAPSTGFSTVQFNLPATVQNSGVELELTTINVKKKNWSWRTVLNLTVPKTKLVSFPNISNYALYANKYQVGQSLNIYKAYHFTGVDPATGTYTFEDYDKDGKISYPNDLQTRIEKGLTYYGGFQNTIQYKNWQLDIAFQFVKQTGFDVAKTYFLPPGFAQNQPVSVLGRWQRTGDITNIERFTQAFGGPAYTAYSNAYSNGDNMIADASFIRLRNLSIAYQIPDKWKDKYHIQHVKIYAQAQNLITLTNYQGMDPERASSSTLPPLRLLVFGIQLTL